MAPQTRLLMDLRPCYGGYAGVAQEARLLFGLWLEGGFARLGGLLSGVHFVDRRRPARRGTEPFDRMLEQSRALIAQDTGRHHAPFPLGMLGRHGPRAYAVAAYGGRDERLDLAIDPGPFGDYLWTRLFERTLPAGAHGLLPRAEYFATELGHENARHLCFLPPWLQRGIDMAGWDVFLSCGLSPYRAGPGTVIRYYDALPLLSPHTVGEPWRHAASHAATLRRNMAQGAHFVCPSEPVRADLLRLFPGAAGRVHTIPCVLAPGLRPEPCSEETLRSILSRRGTNGGTLPSPLPPLVLAVGAMEPRKNYGRLFRAFARARESRPIHLVLVGNTGWRAEAERAELAVLDGATHLAGVPADELRQLYSAAHLVAAPSRAEGFDYSGAEAMACGTPVLASDTPTHRAVYGDAACYVDGYDEAAMGERIAALCDLPGDAPELAGMRERGLRQVAPYGTRAVRERWMALFDAVRAGLKAGLLLLAGLTAARAQTAIGVAGPGSGPYAAVGRQMQAGAELAVADINKAGGVLGKPVTLEVADDGCEPAKAAAAARGLVEKKVAFVAGHFCSGSSIAAGKIYAEAGVVEISPGSVDPRVTDEGGWNIFRLCGRDDQQGSLAGRFLVGRFKGKRLAVLNDRSAYGKALAEEVAKAVKANGGSVALSAAYPPGERDYAATAVELKQAKIEVVYVAAASNIDAGLIVRQAKEAGMALTAVGSDALMSRAFWRAAGPAAEGTVMTGRANPRRRPAASKVMEAFKAAGQEADENALGTYAAVQAWAAGVRKAGSTDGRKVAASLRTGQRIETVLGPVGFDHKGDLLTSDYVFYAWKDGGYDELDVRAWSR